MKKRFIATMVCAAILITTWVGATYVANKDAASTADSSTSGIQQIDATNVKYASKSQDKLIEDSDISDEEPSDESVVTTVSEIEESDEPEYIEYTIVAGDSLWKIAKEFYGNGNLYTKIASDNGITTNDVIHPGNILHIYSEEMTASNVQYSSAPVEDIEVESIASSSEVEVIGTSSFDGDMSVEEAVAILRDVPSTDTSGMTYLGNYKITGYDPHCSHCCGKTNGITASGNPAEFGVSVGCNSLPLGTEIYIEGYGFYRVDDRGGMSSNLIDIAAPSHEACYTLTGSANVYLVP